MLLPWLLLLAILPCTEALPRWLPGLAHRPDVSAPPLSSIDLEQQHYYNEQHHHSFWKVVLLTPMPQLVWSLQAHDVLACMYVLVSLVLVGKAYQYRRWQKSSSLPVLQECQVEWWKQIQIFRVHQYASHCTSFSSPMLVECYPNSKFQITIGFQMLLCLFAILTLRRICL